jgi:hypothetical protein
MLLVVLAGCHASASCRSSTSPDASSSTLTVTNRTAKQTTVNVAFGADSSITGWPFCTSNPSGCSFTLAPSASQALPLGGYLNATFAFDAPVGCGATKAEVNIGNPAWSSDTADVSLVDGYSDKVQIEVSGEGLTLGPPMGATGNEKVYGLFPNGCDICVQRKSPPCGIAPGPLNGDGCKAGPDQYHPAVPCQWSGSRGRAFVVALVP